MQSSLAVEGELPEDGLAAYGDDGDDMMMALARKLVLDHDRGIVSGGEEEDENETMEEVFAKAQERRERPLRSCWWTTAGRWSKWSRRRSSVGTATDTTPTASGRPSSLSRSTPSPPTGMGTRLPRSTACPVLDTGGTATAINDEAPEPQQSLFSWAEFMAEEPVKPRGRGPQAAARDPLDVRVGDDAGTAAREKSSRSARDARPHDRKGEDTARSVSFPLHGHVCSPFCVSGACDSRPPKVNEEITFDHLSGGQCWLTPALASASRLPNDLSYRLLWNSLEAFRPHRKRCPA